MRYKQDFRKITRCLVSLSFQPMLVGDGVPTESIYDSKIAAEIREADWQDSEGVYDLINRCYDKAKGNSSDLARGLGYTNSVDSVFLSYKDGNASMQVGTNYVFVSKEQMRKYLGEKK